MKCVVRYCSTIRQYVVFKYKYKKCWSCHVTDFINMSDMCRKKTAEGAAGRKYDHDFLKHFLYDIGQGSSM